MRARFFLVVILILSSFAPAFAQVKAPATILTKHILQSGSSPWLGDWNFFTYGYQIPSGTNLDGLSGTITISGTAANTFGETLVLAGAIPNCPVNGSDPIGGASYYSKFPGTSVIFEWILKGEPNASLPVSITFPVSVPVTGCFFVTLNSGDPQGGTFTTSIDLTLSYDTGPAPVIPPFRGGEGAEILHGYNPPSCGTLTNCVNTVNIVPSIYIYTGDMYNQSSTLLGLYGSVSAAAIQSGNAFNVVNTYYLNPACSQSGNFQGPFATFIIPPTWINLGARTLSGQAGLSDDSSGINQNSGLPVSPGSCIEWVSDMTSGNAPTNIESRVYPWLTSSSTVTTSTTSSSSVINPVPPPPINTSKIIPIVNMTSTLAPQKTTFTPAPQSNKGKPVQDLGPISWQTSLAGFTWNNSASSITLSIPAIASVTQVVSALQLNNTETAYQFPGMNEFFKSRQYNTSIILQGNVPVATPISMTLVSTNQASICDTQPHTVVVTGNASIAPPCHNQCFGPNLCFDWGDLANFSPSYNNLTDTLTFTVNGAFTIDPLAIDGSCTGSSATSSQACSVTTANANDLIIVDSAIVCHQTTFFNNAVSDNHGLTWHKRLLLNASWIAGSFVQEQGEWYAVAATAQSYTVTSSWGTGCTGGIDDAEIIAFGVSGASTTNPFDPHSGLPVSTSATSGTSASVTVFTNNYNDMIISAMHLNTKGTGTDPTPNVATKIASVYFSSFIGIYAGFRLVTPPEPGISASYSWSTGSVPNSLIADAINPITVATIITLPTLPSGAPFASIGISGCNTAQTNSSFTANSNLKIYEPLTASCVITLTNPVAGIHTRYCFNISPHPTCGISLTLTTPSTGTSTYSNSTYYQLNNNFTLTPQTPTTWDAIYTTSISGTFLGVASHSFACPNTASGGGVVACNGNGKAWFDYNLPVSTQSPIGNTWFAVAPSSFTQVTGNNVNNVNYIQSSSSSNSGNFDWLLVVPVLLLLVIMVIARRRL